MLTRRAVLTVELDALLAWPSWWRIINRVEPSHHAVAVLCCGPGEAVSRYDATPGE